MARTVLSLALLVALSLAILHLVSAEQQQQELEDNSNEAVQAKLAEVDQVRILREAEPRRDNNRESKHPRKSSHKRSKKGKKCGKNGKKCEKSRRKGGSRPLGRSNKRNRNKSKKDKKGKKPQKCKTVKGKKICSRKKAGRRPGFGRSNKRTRNKGKNHKKGNNKPQTVKAPSQHQNGPGARQLPCNTANEASRIISTGIITYRRYYNHDKQIKRTLKDLARLVQKSKAEKLVKYTTAADELKSTTTDGTTCPADPAKNAEVIATVAALEACAGAESPIVKVCVPPADAGVLQPKVVECETAYEPWIEGFKECFEESPVFCDCFIPLNSGNPPVPDEAPQSCAKPNSGSADPDWIKQFSFAAKDAVKACKAEITKCKESVTAASALMSACCVKPAATARTNRRRKLLNQALLKSQFNKINLH